MKMKAVIKCKVLRTMPAHRGAQCITMTIVNRGQISQPTRERDLDFPNTKGKLEFSTRADSKQDRPVRNRKVCGIFSDQEKNKKSGDLPHIKLYKSTKC